MLDKNPFEIKDFTGINRASEDVAFDANSHDVIPFNDALECTNLVFTREGGLRTRPPVRNKSVLFLDAGDTGRVHQHWKIARLGTTYYNNRWLYITYDTGTNTGRLYDSGVAVPGTPIKTLTGMKYCSVINIYGRLYISPLSDFGEPLTGSGGIIYVYDGTTFRAAGGSAPAGATLTITDTNVAGANVTPGLHIGAIAFETNTGFITPPGPATRVQVTIAATGNRAARFANVDLGPAGTVARHLLLTKTIPTYDGIQDNWELFFALRIPNNTATTGDVVVPDTGLVDSADYLLSEKAELPSCAAISLYATHLMYNGIKTDQRITYVSKSIDPETVDETEDYIQIFDGIPSDILNGKELRGTYYIFKENTTFVTRESVGEPPNTWQVDLVDSGYGLLPAGIADVMANPGGLVADNLLVANMSGVFVFSGSFSSVPLSLKIQAIFDNFPKSDLKYLKMAVDPIKRRIYLLIGDPLAEGERTRLYVGDYWRGLSPNTIRWSRWDLELSALQSIALRGYVHWNLEGDVNAPPVDYTIYKYPPGNIAGKVALVTGTVDYPVAYQAVNYLETIPGSAFGNYILFEVLPQIFNTVTGAPGVLPGGDGDFYFKTYASATEFLFDGTVVSPRTMDVSLELLPVLDISIYYNPGLSLWPNCTFKIHDGPLITDPVIFTGATHASGPYAGLYRYMDIDLVAGNAYYVEVPSQAPPGGPPNESGGLSHTAVPGSNLTSYQIITAP